MYSIEDIENMCTFDSKKLSYDELDAKYHQLSSTMMCIFHTSFANDKKKLEYAYFKLIDAIKKANLMLDYYDRIGKGRRNAI